VSEIGNIAKAAQERAWQVIRDTSVMDIWSSVGATINLVGSLKTGLLINRRDIDFHIYTNPFNLADSFSAMARIAEDKRIKSITYSNLLDAKDQCIEWHAFYEDATGELWQMDMIHILPGSRYAGYFEKVAERISSVLTEETREAILKIKYTSPQESRILGIDVYRAVIEGGARDFNAFCVWMDNHPHDGIVEWIP
jgi:hypothetical protein